MKTSRKYKLSLIEALRKHCKKDLKESTSVRKSVEQQVEQLDAETLLALHNLAMYEEPIGENDSEFFETHFHNNAYGALGASHYGNYDYNDSYVHIDDLGNLVSGDGFEDWLNIDAITKYLLEYPNVAKKYGVEVEQEMIEEELEEEYDFDISQYVVSFDDYTKYWEAIESICVSEFGDEWYEEVDGVRIQRTLAEKYAKWLQDIINFQLDIDGKIRLKGRYYNLFTLSKADVVKLAEDVVGDVISVEDYIDQHWTDEDFNKCFYDALEEKLGDELDGLFDLWVNECDGSGVIYDTIFANQK